MELKRLWISKFWKENFEKIETQNFEKLCWSLSKFGAILFYFYICDRTDLFDKKEK